MTAIELANYMENTERWNIADVRMQDCAEMLRKQDAAIKQLREALDEINKHANGIDDQWCGAIAYEALAATEEFK